jgi:hypothetical protein
VTDGKKKEGEALDALLLEEGTPTDKMTKAEIVKYAEDHNIAIDPKAHKDEILDTIQNTMRVIPPSGLDNDMVLGDDEPYRAMDAYDTDLIIQEIMGQVDVALKDAYLYEFIGTDGKIVRGFTKIGVDEMTVLSADYLNIAYRVFPDSIKVEETGDAFKANIVVGRYQLRRTPDFCPHCHKGIPHTGTVSEFLVDTMVGAARQVKEQKTRRGYVRTNPFAYRVALSKAVRNAKLSLMSHEFKVKMMSYLLGEKAVKALPPMEKSDTRVIQLTGDSYISEADRRKLHAVAGKRGMSHDDILVLIKQFGADSTNRILSSDLPEIIEKIKEKPEVTLSPEIKKGLEICGKSEEFGLAQLAAGVAKTGNVKEAEEKLLKWLNNLADKQANKGE